MFDPKGFVVGRIGSIFNYEANIDEILRIIGAPENSSFRIKTNINELKRA
jgi:hypothetical protein